MGIIKKLKEIVEKLHKFYDKLQIKRYDTISKSEEKHRKKAEEKAIKRVKRNEAKSLAAEEKKKAKLQKERLKTEHKEAELAKKMKAAEAKKRVEEEKRQKRLDEQKAKKAEKDKLRIEKEESKAKLIAEREESKSRIRAEREESKARIQAEREKAHEEKEKIREEKERIREAEKAKADKLKEDKKKAKEDEKLRNIELKKEAADKKAKEREEKRIKRAKEKVEAKKKAKSGKIDKKQAKKIKELENALTNGLLDKAKEKEIDELKKSLKESKKSSSKINEILNMSLSSKKLLIIEIDENFINITDLAVSGSKEIETKRITVFDSIKVNTPPDAFIDGTLTNTQSVALEIIRTIAKNNIKTKDVIWISSENSILVRDVQDFPLQKEKKANLEIVKSKASEILPIDVDNYIIKYKILSYIEDDKDDESDNKSLLSAELDLKDIASWFKKEKNNKANIQLIAFPLQLEKVYIQLSGLCGLNTKFIDYSNNGMINMLKREYRNKNSIQVEINDTYTNLYSVSSGKILAQSKLNTGYYNSVEKLIQSGELGSSLKEVWINIQKEGLLEGIDNLGIQGSKYSTDTILALRDLRSDLETIIDKIRSEVNSMTRKLDNQTIDSVTIICNEPNFPDLSEDIINITNVKAVQLSSFDWINSIDDSINIPSIIHGIGVALEPITFVTSAVPRKEQKMENAFNLCALLIIIIGSSTILGTMIYTNIKVNKLNSEKQRLTLELENAHEAEIIAKRTRLSESTLKEISNFSNIETNVDKMYYIIEDIEDITPDSVIYTTISSSNESLNLVVYTATRDDAIKLLEGLEGLEYFSDVTTSGIQSVADAGGNNEQLGNFTLSIECTYLVEEENIEEVTTEAAEESTESVNDDTEVLDYE